MSPLLEIRPAKPEEVEGLVRLDRDKEEREKKEMEKIELLLKNDGYAVLEFSEGLSELGTDKVTPLEQIQKMGKKIREHMSKTWLGDEDLAFSYRLEDFKGTLIVRIRK